MKLLQGKFTYANVMATIAVFIALGGSAYAATQLKKNSVGTKQLKKGAVTAQKIKKGTITGTQINASKLGTVPNAANAANSAALAGVGISGLVTSDHLLTGHASVEDGPGVTLISDPRSGLRVTTSPPGHSGGELGLVNTNSSDSIEVNGIGFADTEGGSFPFSLRIGPGETKALAFDAYTFFYGTFEAQRLSPSAQTLNVTCMRSEIFSCVGVG